MVFIKISLPTTITMLAAATAYSNFQKFLSLWDVFLWRWLEFQQDFLMEMSTAISLYWNEFEYDIVGLLLLKLPILNIFPFSSSLTIQQRNSSSIIKISRFSFVWFQNCLSCASKWAGKNNKKKSKSLKFSMSRLLFSDFFLSRLIIYSIEWKTTISSFVLFFLFLSCCWNVNKKVWNWEEERQEKALKWKFLCSTRSAIDKIDSRNCWHFI